MLEPASPQTATPRAFLRVGGITVARHQVGLALALGCERIICIARTLEPEIVALQHAAEQAGARFHVVTGPRALIGLVTASDDVISLADGLLALPEYAREPLEARPAVLVQPIEVGLPAGFERIDLNHAAAGAMRIPGKLITQLADLPADFDAVSALQRIALQAGISQTNLPTSLSQDGAWRLIRNEAEANAAEAEWIRKQTSATPGSCPTEFLVRIAVRSFGPALLHAGSGGNTVVVAAFLLLLLALTLGWFGFAATAFVFCGLAWAVRRAAALLLDIERQSLTQPSSFQPREVLFVGILDLVLIATMAWNATGAVAGSDFGTRVFAPAMLIAMIRLIPRAVGASWTTYLDDRTLLSVLLAAIAVGGLPVAAVAALAAVLALLGVAWPERRSQLTRA